MTLRTLLLLAYVASSQQTSESALPVPSRVTGGVLAQGGEPSPLAAANRLYREGDYAAAARNYEALLAARPSAVLHFNLANAYFKEAAPHSLGKAIAGYLRAYEAAPRDPDIRHNLEFALRRAGESLVPPGTPAALHRLFHWASLRELLGLQWIGYWACLLLGSMFLLRPESRPRLHAFLLASLAFWTVFGSWWGLRKWAGIENPGVVLEPNAEARSGPAMKFPVSFNAPEGRRVAILSESGDWVEIGVLREGLKGWTLSKNIERL